jgi:hypothetical protein
MKSNEIPNASIGHRIPRKLKKRIKLHLIDKLYGKRYKSTKDILLVCYRDSKGKYQMSFSQNKPAYCRSTRQYVRSVDYFQRINERKKALNIL